MVLLLAGFILPGTSLGPWEGGSTGCGPQVGEARGTGRTLESGFLSRTAPRPCLGPLCGHCRHILFPLCHSGWAARHPAAKLPCENVLSLFLRPRNEVNISQPQVLSQIK